MKGYKNVGLPKQKTLHSSSCRQQRQPFWHGKESACIKKQLLLEEFYGNDRKASAITDSTNKSDTLFNESL